jgi:hypothetical protein
MARGRALNPARRKPALRAYIPAVMSKTCLAGERRGDELRSGVGDGSPAAHAPGFFLMAPGRARGHGLRRWGGIVEALWPLVEAEAGAAPGAHRRQSGAQAADRQLLRKMPLRESACCMRSRPHEIQAAPDCRLREITRATRSLAAGASNRHEITSHMRSEAARDHTPREITGCGRPHAALDHQPAGDGRQREITRTTRSLAAGASKRHEITSHMRSQAARDHTPREITGCGRPHAALDH